MKILTTSLLLNGTETLRCLNELCPGGHFTEMNSDRPVFFLRNSHQSEFTEKAPQLDI